MKAISHFELTLEGWDQSIFSMVSTMLNLLIKSFVTYYASLWLERLVFTVAGRECPIYGREKKEKWNLKIFTTKWIDSSIIEIIREWFVFDLNPPSNLNFNSTSNLKENTSSCSNYLLLWPVQLIQAQSNQMTRKKSQKYF